MQSLRKKIQDKEYHKKNKEKRNQRRRERYAINKEKEFAKRKIWRQNNIEKVRADDRARSKKNYQAKKERELKRYFSKLAYERKNPDRCKRYYYENKDTKRSLSPSA